MFLTVFALCVGVIVTLTNWMLYRRLGRVLAVRPRPTTESLLAALQESVKHHEPEEDSEETGESEEEDEDSEEESVEEFGPWIPITSVQFLRRRAWVRQVGPGEFDVSDNCVAKVEEIRPDLFLWYTDVGASPACFWEHGGETTTLEEAQAICDHILNGGDPPKPRPVAVETPKTRSVWEHMEEDEHV